MVLDKYLDSYSKKLLNNHNKAKEKEQRNLLTLEDYLKLLEPVVTTLKENKDASLDELRDILHKKSNIENLLKDAIYNKKMAPGAVITYGTEHYLETISLGKTNDIENGVATSENTIYDLASVTKLFTSISVQILHERGLIDLDRKVTYYLPWLPNLKETTVYQLLTFNMPIKTCGRIDKAQNKEEALEVFKTMSVDLSNDGKRPYTDLGAMVLKFVVEKVTGMSFYDFIKENILEVSKMYNTYVSVPEDKNSFIAATGYDGFYYKDGNYRINNDVQPGDCYDAKARILGQRDGDLSGHAGLFSTGKDMSNLAYSLMNYELLSQCDLLHMADNETGKKESGIQYLSKLCYSKNPSQPDSEVYHPLGGRTFASAGWTGTQLTIDPDNKVFYSLLSNRSNNRMTFIDADKKKLVFTGKNGEKLITLPNGKTMVDATRYAWDRDALLVHPVIKLVIQNKFLDDIFKDKGENLGNVYVKTHI